MEKKMPAFTVSGFVGGLTVPIRGLRFFWRNLRTLLPYAVVPLIFNVILYAAVLSLLAYYLWNWEVSAVAWDFLGPVGRWLSAAINWMGWLVKLVVFMLSLGVAFFTFTGVGMALASPLNDMLSEKVEALCVGGVEKASLPLHFTLRAGLLSFGDSMRTLIKQLVCTVVMLPFLLLPLVGFIPMFLVGAYFAGFGFVDAAMARNFLRPPHKKLLTDKKFWQIIGFGAAMQALCAIPFLGMLLMPIGVVSGTLLYCHTDWDTLLADGGLSRPTGFITPMRTDPTQVESQPETAPAPQN